jgi:hypothetical protein
VIFRVPDDQLTRWKESAKGEGISLAAWLRKAADEKAGLVDLRPAILSEIDLPPRKTKPKRKPASKPEPALQINDPPTVIVGDYGIQEVENKLQRAIRIKREWEELLADHRSVALSEFGSLEEYERRSE